MTEPVVAITPRVADLLERRLGVTARWVTMRGHDAELDAAIVELARAAATHRASCRMVDDPRQLGRRSRQDDRRIGQPMPAAAVADALGISKSAVTAAVRNNRVNARKDDTGQLWFDPDEVHRWQQRRQARSTTTTAAP